MYSKLEVPTDAKYIVVLAVQEVAEVLAVLHGNEFSKAQEVAELAVAEWLAEWKEDDDNYAPSEPYIVDTDVGLFDVEQVVIERLFYDGSNFAIQINFVG
jgi:hypothetical protein